MTSGAPPVRPLDVRREQLRELGHTDAEISAIILKEVPPPQPQAAATGMTGAGGVAGQTGVMSGVLNNLSVAMALATGFLPSIATDMTNLLGAHSSLHQRSRAGVFLAVSLRLSPSSASPFFRNTSSTLSARRLQRRSRQKRSKRKENQRKRRRRQKGLLNSPA